MTTPVVDPWYTLTPEAALRQLDSHADTGLALAQITQRQQVHGPNELVQGKTRSQWDIFLDQFKNSMLILLIGVAVISGVIDALDWQKKIAQGDIPFKDTIAIVLIVILNGLLGFVQESRAEKALAALKQLAAPKVRALRAGQVVEIAARELVPGDVILLEAGVQVAADGRLLEAIGLQIREAALTGEAGGVTKVAERCLNPETALGDRVNCVFQGTEVLQGRGKVLVTATGMDTELGRIAAMLQAVEAEPTPLQRRMEQLSNTLVTGALALVALVVGAGLLQAGWGQFKDLLEVSLSMAVAVVPEGLPAVITVTLAVGTQRMVRRQALIRKLPAVETLGSVTVICSDKTGTLTQNKMVVRELHTGSTAVQVTGEGYAPEGELSVAGRPLDAHQLPEVETLLLACVLCNDAVLQPEGRTWTILGDPTEGALLSAAGKIGLRQSDLAAVLPRMAEVAFTSERKRMSVLCRREAPDSPGPAWLAGSPYWLMSKGSSELILERCTHMQVGSQIEPLAPTHRQAILERNNQLAKEGLRVLGFAAAGRPALPDEPLETWESDLVWLGLVAMLDAPRPEAREAVARCRQAGIRVVMITGDHPLTAQTIARDLGIAQMADPVVTGVELNHLTPAELDQRVTEVNVYARVAPEHKLRIVQSLQRQGELVAMTGDGVNDAPALKQADIGVAMGITGTDVSKEASDMVLLDDNFATIVAAVEEGRVVYSNIRRFIKYILGSNIGEILTIGAAPLLGLAGTPLSPLQILWMNLVTDGLPALALALEPAEAGVMQRSPHSPKESIFARGLGLYMIRIGIVLGVIGIAVMTWAYIFVGPTDGGERWRTIVFTTLCLSQMGHALAVRSDYRLTLNTPLWSNPFVFWAISLTTVLQLMLIYVPPLRDFFGTRWISPIELMVCIGFSLLMFVWIEAEKLLMLLLKRRPAA
ncbi:MAG: cation-translocating P-type ATPase [Gloeomargaritaceae cyanobacterium C42_A2020_066]|nr:cation-translocating P-type ATPase [Gloeomargaritaceae cyanobacterium C42_A2020_066]